MLQLILMLGLTGAQVSKNQVAQVQPCNWPNKCEQTAQIQPCNWPNKCSIENVVAQTAGPITTCDFPKKCG